jgi:hypothetical protein
MIQFEDDFELPIRHIKLSNGEQLVSYVSSSSVGDTIVLENPCLLNLFKEEDSTFTYYFTRYMPLSDTGLIHVNGANIVAYTDVTQDVQDRYIRAALKYHEKDDEEEEDYEEDSFDSYETESFSIH